MRETTKATYARHLSSKAATSVFVMTNPCVLDWASSFDVRCIAFQGKSIVLFVICKAENCHGQRHFQPEYVASSTEECKKTSPIEVTKIGTVCCYSPTFILCLCNAFSVPAIYRS